MNKKITVILPIHKFDDNYKSMLDNSLKNINEFHNDIKLLIICPDNVYKTLSKYDFGQKLEVNIEKHNFTNSDFTTQINLGINKCDTEWFSILEIDDEYTLNWLKSMNEYMTEYNDVDVFLPIVKDVNQDGVFINYTNESTWAYGFSEKQGYLDNEVLLDFQNYQTSGGLYKTEVIKENGLFKDNIKLTFTYELLLRLTHNGHKIMTVPKVGYIHVNFREDSLFWNYKNDEKSLLTEDEVKFWLDTAKKEFFFKNKRDIIYENK